MSGKGKLMSEERDELTLVIIEFALFMVFDVGVRALEKWFEGVRI